MKQVLVILLKSLCIMWCLGLVPGTAAADVGLIIETPTGLAGFLSDVGHSSVWISHGCLSAEGAVLYCENSAGIVLSSTAYWSNPGAAAIPAELFFLGTQRGAAGNSVAAWNTSLLAVAYPEVDPGHGRKYLGRAWRRSMRVTTFTTAPAEDRRVLALVEQQRKAYRYSYSHRNCAYYAQQILQMYLGSDLRAHHLFDVGIYTPRALERTLLQHLERDPEADFRTITFPGTLLQSWRQPPRNFCEAALFDPKYAVPLLMFQPYIYAGFGVCYGVVRLTTTAWGHRRAARLTALALVGQTASARTGDRRLEAYRNLTGSLPEGASWSAESTPVASSSTASSSVSLSSASAGGAAVQAVSSPSSEP